MSRHITNGMAVGRQSEPWFLKKFEPVFGMTKAQAREYLGMKGVTETETWKESDVWSEGAQGALMEQETAQAAE